MMDRKNRIWPWVICLVLCVSFAAVAAVITLSRFRSDPPEETTDMIAQKFDERFREPDWAALYRLAQQEESLFENASTFARYMEARISDGKCTYTEVQPVDPDTRRCVLYCGEDKLAAYTISVREDSPYERVELFYDRAFSAYIQLPPEYTPVVNGVSLTQDFLVHTLHTRAESILPEGVHGFRLHSYAVSGLLMPPEVTAVDASGQTVPLLYDEGNGVYYVESIPQPAITEAQKQFIIDAAKTDAAYAIAAVSNQKLAEYFAKDSDLYALLTTNPRNYQKYTSASITDVAVEQFCQYSDQLFSANVKLTQNIIRTNGTRKVIKMDKTYLFGITDSGQYRVLDYTNEHLTETVETVRLTFTSAEKDASIWAVVEENTVDIPDMVASTGIAGWATKAYDTHGNIVYTVRITPDGKVLGGLEPMTLYPIISEE